MTLPLLWVADQQIQKNFELIGLNIDRPVPQARVYNDVNISITNTTLTALTYNSERFDDGGLHSTSANTSRLTASVTGLWQIGTHALFAANATGVRQVKLRVNAATDIAIDTAVNAGAGDDTTVNLTTLYRLAVGDYVETIVWQNSGGALNVKTSASSSPEFWMVRLAGYSGEQYTR